MSEAEMPKVSRNPMGMIDSSRLLGYDKQTEVMTFARRDGGAISVATEWAMRQFGALFVGGLIDEYQRHERNEEDMSAAVPNYINRTFGRLVDIDRLLKEAVFQTDPDSETVTISIDMLNAVAEALVKSGTVDGKEAVDGVFRATGTPKPKPPKPVSVESSIEFLVSHVSAAKDPDAVFARGGEIMQRVSMAIINVTKSANDEDEDEDEG